jgi:hypothetical protein
MRAWAWTVAVCVALAAGCGGSDEVVDPSPAAEREVDAARADVVAESDAASGDDLVSETGAGYVVDWSYTTERQYPTEFKLAVSDPVVAIELGDPGSVQMSIDWNADLTVTNGLDDRPSPFVFGGYGEDVFVRLYFETDGLGLDGGQSLRSVDGGRTFVSTRAFQRNVPELAVFGELAASSSATFMLAPKLGPERLTGQSGIDEERAAEVAAMLDQDPTFIVVSFAGQLFDDANCGVTALGPRGAELVFVFDGDGNDVAGQFPDELFRGIC